MANGEHLKLKNKMDALLNKLSQAPQHYFPDTPSSSQGVNNMIDNKGQGHFPPKPGEHDGTKRQEVGPEDDLGTNMECETHELVDNQSHSGVEVDVAVVYNTTDMQT